MARPKSTSPKEVLPEVPVEETEVSGKAFDVLDKSGVVVRTFSDQVHGKGSVKLAEEFAAKFHHTVKKHG